MWGCGVGGLYPSPTFLQSNENEKIVNYLYLLKKRSISPLLKISFRRACIMFNKFEYMYQPIKGEWLMQVVCHLRFVHFSNFSLIVSPARACIGKQNSNLTLLESLLCNLHCGAQYMTL